MKVVCYSTDKIILGTAGYAAPEQFGFGQTDERSDIYAVGVLMNVLLVGQLPNIQRYSGMLQGVMERCLCMDASKRFQSAQELYAVLMRIDSQDTDGMNGYMAAGNAATMADNQEKENFIVPWLPGFRTGKPWKNVVATLGYFFMILASVLQIAECSVTVDTFLLETMAIIIYVWITPLLTANAFNWDRHIWPFKLWPKTVTIVLRVILCFLLFYAGISMENYVKFEVLGLAPSK